MNETSLGADQNPRDTYQPERPIRRDASLLIPSDGLCPNQTRHRAYRDF